MKIFITILALLALTAGMAVADNHAIKLGTKDGVGSYLTDAKGMTLYYFTKDMVNKSACAGDCVTRWPLYYREKVEVPEGVPAEDFGTIKRDDGKMQTTFRGMPLYYFFKDKAAGDVLGQGVNNVWYVIDPATFKR